VTQLAEWARAAVRRLIRTETRKLAARLDRESRELERWLRKTNDPDEPLGYRPPIDWSKYAGK
jgi:hypothetical protein